MSGAQDRTITTERLSLRPHLRADYPASIALWADPIVTRHIGGRPFTAEEVWTRMLRYVGHWSVLGFGYWVVLDRATGEFVGEVGFADYQRELDPPFGDAPEIGWVLTPAMHGRGYATEAVRAALAWSDANLPGRRTVCMIDPGNDASLRVAAKCGYREYACTTYHGNPVHLFERIPP